MVKKFTQESQTQYQKAVEYAKKEKLELDSIPQNRFGLQVSLRSCGISGSRLPDILENNGITEDEATKLVNASTSNPYIFGFVKLILINMFTVGHPLPLPLSVFIVNFLGGELKQPQKKPPRYFKKFFVVMGIKNIQEVYGIKPYQGGIAALAEGMGETTNNIQKIWQSRNSKDSVSSGIAFDKITLCYDLRKEDKALNDYIEELKKNTFKT